MLEEERSIALAVMNNLEQQHDWESLKLHQVPLINAALEQSRYLISGLPPRRLYVHPDEQIEILKAGQPEDSHATTRQPEFEWVLPTQILEKWTIGGFAAVFDSIHTMPGSTSCRDGSELTGADGASHQRFKRQKRILLAVPHDDSTVVYYFIHDGIVKPRQN